MVTDEMCARGAQRLSGIAENPLREARLIAAFARGMSLSDIIVKGGEAVGADGEKIFFECIEKRAAKMPLAYITGKREFYGLEFEVNDKVLIPRPDTETLVEFAINAEADSAVDICTGSGCIAVALKKHRPDMTVAAVDISAGALEIAAGNAGRHNADIEFQKKDILKEIPNGRFAMLISNPPYITDEEMRGLMPEVKDFEPHLALRGGADGLLFYRRLCEIAPRILKSGGIAAFEAGAGQHEAVAEIMDKNFENIGFCRDLGNIKRVIYGKLKNNY